MADPLCSFFCLDKILWLKPDLVMKTYRKLIFFLKLLCVYNKGSHYILYRKRFCFPSQSKLLQVPVPLFVVTVKTVFDTAWNPLRTYALKERSLVLGAHFVMAHATFWFLKKVFSDEAGEVFSSGTIVGSRPAGSVFCQRMPPHKWHAPLVLHIVQGSFGKNSEFLHFLLSILWTRGERILGSEHCSWLSA